MIQGKHVSLRAIEEADLRELLHWRNKPEFRIFFREFRELSWKNQLEWFESVSRRDSSSKMFAMVNPSGELLGACGLCYLDVINRSADLSIYIGRDDLYIDEIIAPEAAKLLLNYGFSELNLHRVWAEIYDIDKKKTKFFQDLGFRLEGRFKDSHWTEGRWCDSLFFGILESEFRN